MTDLVFFIKANCTKCKACLPVCPTQCIYFGLNHYVIDSDRCVSCGQCKGVCPDYAVETIAPESSPEGSKVQTR